MLAGLSAFCQKSRSHCSLMLKQLFFIIALMMIKHTCSSWLDIVTSGEQCIMSYAKVRWASPWKAEDALCKYCGAVQHNAL